ncbi:MAG: hypothetical protein QOJ65_1167 [Fimbriimonadaceae bacterium]|jgi:hypothetical protein|nr:hypothetical protein [Fimbriimonadaceae bacterium]
MVGLIGLCVHRGFTHFSLINKSFQSPNQRIIRSPNHRTTPSTRWYPSAVLWAQAFASFAVWVAYGFIQARRARLLRTKFSAMPRRTRTLLGPILLLGGAATLLVGVGLAGLYGGIAGGQLVPWAWLTVTLAGLAFVHAQTMASLVMISLASETESPGIHGTSNARINDRNPDEAQTPASH